VKQRRLPEQPRFTLMENEDAIGEGGDISAVDPLHAWGRQAVLVQLGIYLVGGREYAGGAVGHGGPAAPKLLVIRVAALGAGAVPGCEGGRFVEKEQFGVEAGLHDGAMASTKFQDAHDPAPPLIVAYNLLAVIVQHAAITEHQSAFGGGDEITEGRNAVL
jgi:hypothetical protein